MSQSLLIQGRELAPSDLDQIRRLIVDHPEWSRWRLSKHISEQWNWRNPLGTLKDMAARTMLVKLGERGLVDLPARRSNPVKRLASSLTDLEWDQTPVTCGFKELGSLEVTEVSRLPALRRQFGSALAKFHYLGFGGTVGENLQYLVRDDQGRILACVLFGAAAWKCADRDHLIGWTAERRPQGLPLITNNTRFLILPWVRVPHLGSWILGHVSRRVSADWQKKYGHPIVLLETFVERDRFVGTVYQAANWIHLGQTQGRTRSDRHHSIQAPIKDIYVYPLHKHFKKVLLG